MGLSVSTEDAVRGGGSDSTRKTLHLQPRLQAGRVRDYASAWQAELHQREGKQGTAGEQKYLIPGGCCHPKGCSCLVVRTEEGRVPACKAAQLVVHKPLQEIYISCIFYVTRICVPQK